MKKIYINFNSRFRLLFVMLFLLCGTPQYFAQDTDGDGIANSIDLDNDNDGILDCTENNLSGSVSNYFKPNGNAMAISNTMYLTGAIQNQAGQMWSYGKIDFSKSFSFSFIAYVGAGSGADGLAIVFHNDPNGLNAVGASGNGIGARGIQKGVVLELDTYTNSLAPANDPNGQHGQIWKSADQSALSAATVYSVQALTGSEIPVTVSWNATTKTISYTARSITISYTGDLVTNIFGTNKVYFGFTASTGAITNQHYVKFASPCSIPLELDTDNDGIPNYLDTDSDGDGCPDAVEGGDNITQAMLDANGRIKVAANGTTTPVVVDASGVPVITNTGSTFNVDGQAQGQTIGSAYTVNPLAAGTTSSNQTINSGTTPSTLSLSGSAGSVQWQSSTDNVTFTNISGATSTSYSPSALTATTYYRAVLTSAGGCTVNSNIITVNVTSNLDAVNDTFSTTAGTSTASVITNDLNNSGTAAVIGTSAGQVSIRTSTDAAGTAGAWPTGITLNTDGTIAVASGTTAGTYTLYYTICNQTAGSPCDTAAVTLTVSSNLDSDGDGIPDSVDLDNDNDGILDTAECSAYDKVTNGTFPTSGGNTNTYTGWTIGGTYASSGAWVSPTGRVNFNSNGLEFRRDASTTTTFQQTLTNVYTGTINLNNLYWTRTPVDNATSTFVFTVSYAGTVYATIDSTTGNTPTVTANNGATVNITTLPTITTTGGYTNSAKTNLSITLPQGLLPSSGDLLFTFNASSHATDVRDIGFGSVTFTTCADTDNDGIPNYLDLDSDGDGCPDAIEGGDNITQAMLNGSNAIGTNASGTMNSPAIATVDANGVPTITNTGSTYNVDGQAQGQTVGTSATVNPTVNAGTVSANQTICTGTTPTAVSLSGSEGTVQWQSSTDNVTFANISGATSTSYLPSALTATTYYRAILTSVGGCTATSNVITVTVNNCIDAIDDTFTSVSPGTSSPSVISNDLNNSGAAAVIGTAAGQVSIRTSTDAAGTAGAWPSGFTLNPDGSIAVTNGTPAGNYTLYYTICNQTAGSPCNTAAVALTVVTIDTDGDGITNDVDLDDDNDGILDTAECSAYNKVTNGIFPTSGGNTNTYTGWTIGGTYASSGSWASPTGRINFNSNGLEFRRDASTTTTFQQTLSNVYTGTINLNNLYWYRTIVDNATSTFTFTVSYAGTVYATIDSTTGNTPTVTANNGATVNITTLPTIATTGYGTSAKTTLSITLPQGSLPSSGDLLFTFNASSHATDVRDIGFGSVTFTTCADTDNDGIPNYLDTDSDGDGCPDAIEGSENVTTSQLNANGSINYAATGGLGSTAGTNLGVPNLVNSGGSADTGSNVGQGIGNSQNANINSCFVDAQNDYNQVPSGTTASGSVLANDSALDGSATTVTAATYLNASGVATPLPLGTATAVYDAAGNPAGTMTLNSNGTYTFVPAANYSGTVPVTYTASNSSDSNDTATLSIKVIPATTSGNNNPIAQNDTASTEVGTNVSSSVLKNDSDPDGNSLSVSSASIPLGTATQVSGVDANGNTVANAGTLTLNSDGTYTFVPAPGFTGYVNPVTYTVSDGNGGTDTASLAITVLPNSGNNTFANDDANTATKGSTMTGNALSNDTDPEGNTQSITSASANGTALTIGSATTIPGVGTLTLNSDGSYTFVPLSTFVGTLSIPYTVCDDGTPPACDTATLYLTSLGTNVCYKPAVTSGDILSTNHGITSLGRAGSDNGNWPMVRKGAWTVLEAKTKGFVVNRLTDAQITAIPTANLVEGMMVYNITQDCLQINVDGTAAGWKCFNTQACPD